MTKYKERERKTCKQNPLFHPILFLDTLSHFGASFLCAEEQGRRLNFLHLQTLSFWVFLSISQATPCCSLWSSIMKNNMKIGLLMGLVPLRSGIYFICIWKREGETYVAISSWWDDVERGAGSLLVCGNEHRKG